MLYSIPVVAGWSSLVARKAHNLEVVSSNLTPATNSLPYSSESGQTSLMFTPSCAIRSSRCICNPGVIIGSCAFLLPSTTRIAPFDKLCLNILMAGKYDSLKDYLSRHHPAEISLSFSEIEKIIGRSLPPSARKYPEWWSNTPVPGRHSAAWLSNGWMADEVNLTAGHVKFRLNGGEKQVAVRQVTASQPSMQVSREPMAETVTVKADCHIDLSFEWSVLGAVKMHDNALVFPPVTREAGLYRITISGLPKTQIYIGESVSLSRRFGNYRHPGPTQQTSLRINALLKDVLSRGASVTVDILSGGVDLRIDGVAVTVDLRDKAMRRMIEQAAIVACGGIDAELANR